MLDDAGVRAGGDDPDLRGLGNLDEAALDGLLELGLQAKVGYAAVHGDDELGQLELPVVLEQLDDVLRLGVEREANVLGASRVDVGALELECAERVGRKRFRVVLNAPRTRRRLWLSGRVLIGRTRRHTVETQAGRFFVLVEASTALAS